MSHPFILSFLAFLLFSVLSHSVLALLRINELEVPTVVPYYYTYPETTCMNCTLERVIPNTNGSMKRCAFDMSGVSKSEGKRVVFVTFQDARKAGCINLFEQMWAVDTMVKERKLEGTVVAMILVSKTYGIPGGPLEKRRMGSFLIPSGQPFVSVHIVNRADGRNVTDRLESNAGAPVMVDFILDIGPWNVAKHSVWFWSIHGTMIAINIIMVLYTLYKLLLAHSTGNFQWDRRMYIVLGGLLSTISFIISLIVQWNSALGEITGRLKEFLFLVAFIPLCVIWSNLLSDMLIHRVEPKAQNRFMAILLAAWIRLGLLLRHRRFILPFVIFAFLMELMKTVKCVVDIFVVYVSPVERKLNHALRYLFWVELFVLGFVFISCLVDFLICMYSPQMAARRHHKSLMQLSILASVAGMAFILITATSMFENLFLEGRDTIEWTFAMRFVQAGYNTARAVAILLVLGVKVPELEMTRIGKEGTTNTRGISFFTMEPTTRV